MSSSKLWSEFKAWWEGTTIGQEVDAAGAASVTELEALAPEVLESAAATTSTALLSGIAAASPTSAIIAAGVEAAENAFKTAGGAVASTTISTFVSTLHNAVTAQQAAGAVTPVAGS